MDWGTMIPITVSVIGLVILVIRYFVKHEHRHTKLESELSHIMEKINGFTEVMNTIKGIQILFKNPDLAQLILKINTGGNPYSIEEKEELFNKYRNANITLSEAKRLREIISEDIDKTENLNSSNSVALALLLLGLGALIGYLLTKE